MADPIVVAVIVSYFVLLFVATYYAMRRTKGLKDYYVAGRKLNTVLLTATISATVIGASATMTAVRYVYTKGLPGMWIDLAGGIGLILLGLFLARKVRAMKVYTLPQMLEERFSHHVRFVASVVVIIVEVAWLALLSTASQWVLVVTLGLGPITALGITMAIVICYTVLGGQRAVAYTDVVQFAIMVIGICFVCLPLALYKVWTGDASDMGTLFPGALDFPINARFDFLDFTAFFFLMALPHLVGSDIYSKVFSAKDGETARKATILSGAIKIIFALVMGALGICAILLYPGLTPSLVLPLMVKNLLGPISPILLGIVIAALLATMMSSADSVLLTGSMVFTNDIYARYFRKKAKGREQVIVSQVAILVLGIAAFYLAYKKPDILDTLKLGYTVFTAGVILPVLVSFHRTRLGVTPAGAMVGIMAGAAVSLYLLEVYKKPLYDLDPVLWGMAACLMGMFVTSLIDRLLFPKGPFRKTRGARTGRGTSSSTR